MSNYYEDSRTRAMRLPLDELRREAAPAFDRMHRCRDCWPCACAQVLEERSGWMRDMMLTALPGRTR